MVYRFSSDMKLPLNTWYDLKPLVKTTQKLNTACRLIMAFPLWLFRNEVGLRVAHSHVGEEQPFLLATLFWLITFISSVKWNLQSPWTTSSNKQPIFYCFSMPGQVRSGSHGWTKSLEHPRVGDQVLLFAVIQTQPVLTPGFQPQNSANWEFNRWPVVFLQKMRRVFKKLIPRH